MFLLHRFKRLFTALLLLVLGQYALAEGTLELAPPSSNGKICFYHITSTYGSYNSERDNALNVHIKDPGTEKIIFGLGDLITQSANKITGYYRIIDPDGVTIMTAQMPQSGAGYIADYAEAIAGPRTPINMSGYAGMEFLPTKAGNYTFLFSNSANFSIPGSVFYRMVNFDISVVNKNTNLLHKGRLWTKVWSLLVPGSNDRLYTKFFVYTTDSVVTSFDLNGVQPAFCRVMCNRTGLFPSADFEASRGSAAGNFGYPEYKLFLNNPDSTLYPSPVSNALFAALPHVTGCADIGYCLNFEMLRPATAEILIDLNGTPGYQPGTEDLMWEPVLNKGPNCLPWDGKDGLGNPVPRGTSIRFVSKVISGLTNFPVYDAEVHQFGFKIEQVRPANMDLRVFWDDSKVGGSVNLEGCTDLTCHPWPDGDNRTMNTWWYSRFVFDTLDFTIETNCPPRLQNDTLYVAFNDSIFFFPLNNDVDFEANIDSLSFTLLSLPLSGRAALLHADSVKVLFADTGAANCTDGFSYQLCDKEGLCDTARVVVYVSLPTPVPTDTVVFDCRSQISLPAIAGIAGAEIRWHTSSQAGTPDFDSPQINADLPALYTRYVRHKVSASCASAAQKVVFDIKNKPVLQRTGQPALCVGVGTVNLNDFFTDTEQLAGTALVTNTAGDTIVQGFATEPGQYLYTKTIVYSDTFSCSATDSVYLLPALSLQDFKVVRPAPGDENVQVFYAIKGDTLHSADVVMEILENTALRTVEINENPALIAVPEALLKTQRFRLAMKDRCDSTLRILSPLYIPLLIAPEQIGQDSIMLPALPAEAGAQYTLYRSVDGGDFLVFAEQVTFPPQIYLPGNEGFEHCFYLKAIWGDTLTSYSNIVCITLPNLPEVYNVMTPNGDGVNDSFEIKNLALYPNNSLTVFDRWGKQVYRATPYTGGWQATNLSEGIYFYRFTAGPTNISGYVQIMR